MEKMDWSNYIVDRYLKELEINFSSSLSRNTGN